MSALSVTRPLLPPAEDCSPAMLSCGRHPPWVLAASAVLLIWLGAPSPAAADIYVIDDDLNVTVVSMDDAPSAFGPVVGPSGLEVRDASLCLLSSPAILISVHHFISNGNIPFSEQAMLHPLAGSRQVLVGFQLHVSRFIISFSFPLNSDMLP